MTDLAFLPPVSSPRPPLPPTPTLGSSGARNVCETLCTLAGPGVGPGVAETQCLSCNRVLDLSGLEVQKLSLHNLDVSSACNLGYLVHGPDSFIAAAVVGAREVIRSGDRARVPGADVSLGACVEELERSSPPCVPQFSLL